MSNGFKFMGKNPDGLAKPINLNESNQVITEISNQTLQKLPKSITHTESIEWSHTHQEEGSDAVVVFETVKPCILKNLTYYLDNKSAYFQTSLRDKNGETLPILKAARPWVTASFGNPTPNNLKNYTGDNASNHFIDRFNITDDPKGEFIIGFRGDLYCPSGVRIRSISVDGHATVQALTALVVYFDD